MTINLNYYYNNNKILKLTNFYKFKILIKTTIF